MTFELSKISAHIGAIVHGVDPSGELAEDTVRQLRLALAEHKALVSRIDKAVQKGALHKNTAARKKSRAARIAAGAAK